MAPMQNKIKLPVRKRRVRCYERIVQTLVPFKNVQLKVLATHRRRGPGWLLPPVMEFTWLEKQPEVGMAGVPRQVLHLLPQSL